MIPENWETNEMNLWLPHLTTLRDFPGFSSGRENPCGAFRIPRVGEVELTLEGTRERTREETVGHRENLKSTCRGKLPVSRGRVTQKD